MKLTIEIDDVEGLEPFRADALAALLGSLPKVEQVESPKTDAPEPAKQEAKKPRAKAKPAPKAEPEPEKVAEPQEDETAKAEKVKTEPPKVETKTQKVKSELPKAEPEPPKTEPIESTASTARTKEELAPLLVKYCRSKVGGIEDVQTQFKEFGIKALDEATPEQMNTIAERLGF